MFIILSRPIKFTGDGDFVAVGTRVEVDSEEGRRLCLKGAAVISSSPIQSSAPNQKPELAQIPEPKPIQAEAAVAPKPVEKKVIPGKKITGKK